MSGSVSTRRQLCGLREHRYVNIDRMLVDVIPGQYQRELDHGWALSLTGANNHHTPHRIAQTDHVRPQSTLPGARNAHTYLASCSRHRQLASWL